MKTKKRRRPKFRIPLPKQVGGAHGNKGYDRKRERRKAKHEVESADDPASFIKNWLLRNNSQQPFSLLKSLQFFQKPLCRSVDRSAQQDVGRCLDFRM